MDTLKAVEYLQQNPSKKVYCYPDDKSNKQPKTQIYELYSDHGNIFFKDIADKSSSILMMTKKIQSLTWSK